MGYVAQRCHVPACEETPGVKIIGFSELNQAVISKYRKRYNYFAEYKQLLAQQPDGVIIASPSNTHVEICIEALKRGIHVLVEKPLALSVAEAERIKAVLSHNSGQLFVGLHLRHSRQVRHLKQIIKNKALGDVVGFQSVFSNHHRRRQTVSGYDKKRETGGGVLFDLAYHHVDLFRFLLGLPVSEVSCSVSSNQHEDDVGFMSLKFGESYSGQSFFSSVTHNEHLIKVFFTDGIALLDFFKSPSLYRFDKRNSVTRKLLSEVKYSLTMGMMALNLFRKVRVEAYLNQVIAFQQTLTGQQTDLATFEDGLAALKVIEAAYQSNHSGRWMQVK